MAKKQQQKNLSFPQQMFMKISFDVWSLNPRAGKWEFLGANFRFKHGVRGVATAYSVLNWVGQSTRLSHSLQSNLLDANVLHYQDLSSPARVEASSGDFEFSAKIAAEGFDKSDGWMARAWSAVLCRPINYLKGHKGHSNTLQ